MPPIASSCILLIPMVYRYCLENVAWINLEPQGPGIVGVPFAATILPPEHCAIPGGAGSNRLVPRASQCEGEQQDSDGRCSAHLGSQPQLRDLRSLQVRWKSRASPSILAHPSVTLR